MIFFGVGTGRCGTMTLTNLLNSERNVVALHEGKFRDGDKSGDQILPFLTLQNYHAYCFPREAEQILQKTRNHTTVMGSVDEGVSIFGDIAYNYAPFVAVLPRLLCDSKLLFIYRDGRDFVRSAYTAEIPDPTPVGWLDEGRPITRLERYITLGRLRPKPGDPLEVDWPDLTPVEKNAWLWAETNRLILEGLNSWKPQNIFRIKFEDFAAAPLDIYKDIRNFLGIVTPLPEAVEHILEKPINARRQTVLPPWQEWDEMTTREFWKFADSMMKKLGYA